MVNGCLLCGIPEPDGYLPNGKVRIYVPTGDFVCSGCTRVLINSTPAHIKESYDRAVELGFQKKVDFLERYLEDNGDGESEVCDAGRNMVRKRTGREVKSSGRKVRQKHTTG